MANSSNVYLQYGDKLQGGKYIIERKISSGGFGAVYLARTITNRSVAIKEFLPSGIKCRTDAKDKNINIQLEEDKNNFSLGLESFFRKQIRLPKLIMRK